MFPQLPDDLTLVIVGFLDPQSLGRICATNRRLRRAACSSAVWQPLVLALGKPASVIETARAACPPLNKGWRAVYRELLHLEANDLCWRCAKANAGAREKYEKAKTDVQQEKARSMRYARLHRASHFERLHRAEMRTASAMIQEAQRMVRQAVARQQELEAEYRHAEAALLRARRERERYARPFQF